VVIWKFSVVLPPCWRDTALRAGDMDEAAAIEAKEEAERAMAQQDADFEYSTAAAQLAEAAAQLRALRQIKKL
jgi:F-type H+-transporting ATPase subunit epsilon